jgi:aminoglycoside phosphotransferase (APT) family kinase protein
MVGLANLAGLPVTAVEWATAAASEDVVDVAPVGGGITNTKWVLVLANDERLVLRWADPARWGPAGREHVRREILACQVLVGSGLPAPVLVASDPEGSSAGGPANLLTWRPGQSRLDPLSPSAVDALAQAAVAIHEHPVPDRDRPPTWTFRGLDDPQVPSWTTRPDLWRRAIEIYRAGAPEAAHGLLHRDFHLGNTLWQDDEVTGLIDWAETSWGPPDVDVAHMCSDFAMMHGPADAVRFRKAYLSAGGRLDPDRDATRFWTISDVLGFLPDPAHILPAVGHARLDLSGPLIRERLEGLLAGTLAQRAAG